MNLFLRSRIGAVCLAALGIVVAFGPVEDLPAAAVRVELRETQELLANPGMGWQTFHRFADDDPNLQGLPSASAYFRFYWREIEPADGRIDFARFDELLAHARRAGQKLAFRIMCTGSGQYMDVPSWLKDLGGQGIEFEYGGRTHWVPDFQDALFQEKHFRLIRELGRRYDGHPDLDLVDIGSVGLWGEWHMSGTQAVATGQPVPVPPLAIRLAIIDAWCQAFARTPKVMLIGSEEGMTQAVAKGYGWRADCLGDMGGFSKTWNHMEDFYLQQIERTGAHHAWKQAPVAWETCWDMRKWKEQGWDIPFIFDYALRCHGSYVNNKSAPIPDGTRPEIERFLRKLGYRLVVRRVEHAPVVKAGGTTPIQIVWENIGVAPPYRDDRWALRFKAPNQADRSSVVTITDVSVRGCLPGAPLTNDFVLRVPESVPPGRYPLALGVVEPATREPAVRLAIPGRDEQGWYSVSEMEVAAE